MTVVFVSSFFNHHQKPLCDALYDLTGGAFTFLATAPMPQARRELGYGRDPEPSYVRHSYPDDADPALCRKLINEADVLIFGMAPEALLRQRLRRGKLIFRYSERPLKDGNPLYKYLPRLLRWHWRNPPGKPVYLLCASAFAASDYAKFGLFRKKAYQWGYFPETRRYPDVQALLGKKDPLSILWAGRFLDLKRPADVLEAAKMLLDEGIPFRLTMLGSGPRLEAIRRRADELGLSGHVTFPGAVSPETVREYMEKASLYLFTSDRNEGWGAVVNESMNSGCALVASHVIGSLPFLITPGENGLVYPCGDVPALYRHIRRLLEDPQQARTLGLAACRTVAEDWNAETAARRLMELSRRLLAGETYPTPYASGPCSPSVYFREDWYQP